MEHLIEMTGITKRYDTASETVYALRDVDLTVDRGEYVAIVGQSGSGKSTLMHLIGCLDTPTAGAYRLDGRNVSRLSDKALSAIRNREIGFVFQSFHLIGGLSAVENVELPLSYRGVERRRRRLIAEESLRRTGLQSRMRHTPGEMSGGQQQRVAIARAIAGDPPLILADEPTGNLDSRSREEIMALLDQLHEQGRTVVVITHDPSIARRIPRVVRIADGRIVKDG
ncbi:MAG: ABC transporter ATP-binding protein [Acutalibacteraceae bacterium]|jgi:putative ABC transport system ATP-binding protein